MHGSADLPTPKLRTLIDRELVHRVSSPVAARDLIEFD